MASLLASGKQRAGDLAQLQTDQQVQKNGRSSLSVLTQTARVQGHGDVDLGDISFDLPFIEEPSFSFGCALLSAPAAGWRLPQITVYVRHWIQDETAVYRGARLSAGIYIVEAPSDADRAQPTCAAILHLNFIGFSLKDISRYGEESGAARTSGMLYSG